MFAAPIDKHVPTVAEIEGKMSYKKVFSPPTGPSIVEEKLEDSIESESEETKKMKEVMPEQYKDKLKNRLSKVKQVRK